MSREGSQGWGQEDLGSFCEMSLPECSKHLQQEASDF